MDIQLNLSTHCIETELKRKYNKAVSAYFKAGTEEKILIEQSIEMIHQAIKTLNFPRLRTQYPSLAGGTNRKVILSLVNQDFIITVDDMKRITP